MQKQNNFFKYRSVEEMIENGAYFNEAMEWYSTKYLRCFVEKSFVFVVFFVVFVVFITISFYIKFYYKSVTSLPVIREVEYTSDGNIKVRQLFKESKSVSAQTAIAKYFLEQYVVFRESYHIYNKKDQLKYIKDNSSYQLYKLFLQDIKEKEDEESKNDSSNKKFYFYPIVRSIRMHFDDKKDRATINVIIYVLKSNKIVAKKKLNINIGFSLSDISLVSKKAIPFSFVISSYELVK